MKNTKQIIDAAKRVVSEIEKADKQQGCGDRTAEENEAIDSLRKILQENTRYVS